MERFFFFVDKDSVLHVRPESPLVTMQMLEWDAKTIPVCPEGSNHSVLTQTTHYTHTQNNAHFLSKGFYQSRMMVHVNSHLQQPQELSAPLTG